MAALSATLAKLMARGDPDWPRVALVVRQMAGAATSDAERLKVFEEAAQIMGSAPPLEGGAKGYPEREARWLAASCWNAGLARLRRGDRGGAAPLLRLGLDMLRHLPRWGAPDRAAMEELAAELLLHRSSTCGGFRVTT
ncbi:hypothetical protein MNEG_12815 [Monoraphidium neglectum]|uniref:Uncharacterized protein n=1 Tax=Monoraphidium neglectum TaxID=145388 RepID=A0A0D2M135_9CHLO|nr:hypothetical protein MNEG_12815 [Monoraphidium neglectum]KIY95146.1 hypothetical protein MNEG_12815 [Monoraphidium neglectum]|eukprot:XP_013894166.1 hypothetical protein MNEG_12815 [Monoraphidium neglectum]